MIKIFSHAEPTINKVKQELYDLNSLEDRNQEQENRIEELEKQKKLLFLQKQVKNAGKLSFLETIKQGSFSAEIMKFLRSGFQEAKAQYLEFKPKYDEMVENWEREHPELPSYLHLEFLREEEREQDEIREYLKKEGERMNMRDEGPPFVMPRITRRTNYDDDFREYLWKRTFN